MHLSSRRVGLSLVVSVNVVSLDTPTAERIEPELLLMVEHCESAVLDLSALVYADWFGFLSLLRVVSRCPGKVRFACVCPAVDSLFTLSGLGIAISRYESVEAALADAERVVSEVQTSG